MRIGIVNDSLLAVEALRRAIAKTPHTIAWVTCNGLEAVRQCAADTPDLLLMDLFMPVMDGVESTRRIMAATPCPILIVTGDADKHVAKVFQCLGAGALDVVNTPALDAGNELNVAALHAKFLMLTCLLQEPKSKASKSRIPRPNEAARRLIAIGSSAGGPSALSIILSALPHDFGAAVVIVQHVDAQFAESLAIWLNGNSALPVRLAKEGDQPQTGSALLAGSERHLRLVGRHTLGYTDDPLDCSYRPSIDVFFRSVAQYWEGKVAALLLTGMGRDGALGLRAVREAGGLTIAQDEKSCVVYGMPKAAIAMDAAQEVVSLVEMAPRLVDIVTKSQWASHSS